jgi:hypothetical protein
MTKLHIKHKRSSLTNVEFGIMFHSGFNKIFKINQSGLHYAQNKYHGKYLTYRFETIVVYNRNWHLAPTLHTILLRSFNVGCSNFTVAYKTSYIIWQTELIIAQKLNVILSCSIKISLHVLYYENVFPQKEIFNVLLSQSSHLVVIVLRK